MPARGGIAAFIDAEHALDDYARKLGVNVDELLVSQPDHGEQALEIADMLVRSGAVDMVIVDSVAALVPKAEIEGEMGDSHVGLQARLMSQALRKLTATVHKSNTILVFINQIRMKIGVMFGSPETTTGGNALKFYASIRLDIRRVGSIKVGEDVIGNRTRVKVVKNKLAPPFRPASSTSCSARACRSGDVIDLATEPKIVDKSGAWYSYTGERIGQGRDNAKTFLRENPDIADKIELPSVPIPVRWAKDRAGCLRSGRRSRGRPQGPAERKLTLAVSQPRAQLLGKGRPFVNEGRPFCLLVAAGGRPLYLRLRLTLTPVAPPVNGRRLLFFCRSGCAYARGRPL